MAIGRRSAGRDERQKLPAAKSADEVSRMLDGKDARIRTLRDILEENMM